MADQDEQESAEAGDQQGIRGQEGERPKTVRKWEKLTIGFFPQRRWIPSLSSLVTRDIGTPIFSLLFTIEYVRVVSAKGTKLGCGGNRCVVLSFKAGSLSDLLFNTRYLI